MGKVNIKHQCGHSQMVSFQGRWEDNEYEITSKALRTDCDQCREIPARPKMEQIPASGYSLTSSGGLLAALKGMPGMVKYAEDIRENALRQQANRVPVIS